MPNWCFSSYVATNDEKAVCDLYEKMKSLEERKESLVENGFGKRWLGNLVSLLGGDWKTVYCRGEWSDLEKDDDNGALRFNTISAWGDPDQTIAFLKKYYPNLEFYFIAEESGMGYYATNDADGEFFPERYYFSLPDDPEPYLYEEEELDDFLRDVGKFVGRKINTVEEAQKAILAYNESKEWKECAEVKIYKVINNEQQEEQNQ